MKYIQLTHNQNDKQHYSICVSNVARPQIVSTSIIDLGTPADKVRKGVMLSDEEFDSLPETVAEELSSLIEITEVFDPSAFLNNSTAEELKNSLISNDGGNVVWAYTDTSETPYTEYASSITHADPETHVAFTLATTYAAEIGKVPVKWTATSNPGVTIEIDKDSGNVVIIQDGAGTVSATLTASIDMADYCEYNSVTDYIGKNLKGSRTFNIEVGPIK